MAESLMFTLSSLLGKSKAHHLLHNLAMESKKTGMSLREACNTHPDLSNVEKEKIDSALQPENYIGSCAELIEQIVDKLNGEV